MKQTRFVPLALAAALHMALCAPVVAAGKPAPAPVKEAQEHFARGVDLYRDGDADAALVEFHRAYELVPNYRVLYNIGQVCFQKHDYVAARSAFVAFLRDGAAQIPVRRRREVEIEVERLESRIGRLDVFVDEADADVFIDDILIGKSPLPESKLVNVGSHRVHAVVRDRRVARTVDVAGGALTAVRLTMPEAPKPVMAPAPVVVKPPVVVAAPVAPPPERRTSTRAIVGWSVTAALAAGGGIAGLFALSAARTRDRLERTFPADPNESRDARSRVRTAALAADLLLVGAAAAAAVTVSLPLFDRRANTRVDVGLGRVGVSGAF